MTNDIVEHVAMAIKSTRYENDTMTPFEEGWLAGFHGVDPRMCPYEKFSRDRRLWEMFHRFACELIWEMEKTSE